MAKPSQSTLQKPGRGQSLNSITLEVKTAHKLCHTPFVSTRVPGLLTVHVARPTSREAELARSKLATTASMHSPPSLASLPLGWGSTCPSPSGTAALCNRTSRIPMIISLILESCLTHTTDGCIAHRFLTLEMVRDIKIHIEVQHMFLDRYSQCL